MTRLNSATETKAVELKWLKLNPNAKIPAAQTAGAACFDLTATLETSELIINPGEVTLIPTGLAVEIPAGYEMQIRARSGLSAKFGFALVNGIGTIDCDYRGELKIIGIVLGKNPLTIKSGDRIAQALISPVIPVTHFEAKQISETERAAGGFGSTGVST
jgi:dUTP pyrophosphatase